MENILYSFAKDSEGNHIDIYSARKDSKYYCINCNELMIYKNSGKFGPGRKTPHFSHKATTNCSPETVLHIKFKELIAEKLNKLINNTTSLEFSWNCTYCKNIHKGNYTKKLKKIELEYNLKFCRPDIALLDNNDRVYAVIEIVVTHHPEQKVIDYYYDNNIILIQINLKSNNDINNIDQILKAPNFVNFCLHPKCEICNSYKDKFSMTIINSQCYKCSNLTNIALMTKNNHFLFGPEKFSKDELLLAINNQVIIHDKYFCNVCKTCGKLLNNKLNLRDYLSLANRDTFESKDFFIKFECKNCNI